MGLGQCNNGKNIENLSDIVALNVETNISYSQNP